MHLRFKKFNLDILCPQVKLYPRFLLLLQERNYSFPSGSIFEDLSPQKKWGRTLWARLMSRLCSLFSFFFWLQLSFSWYITKWFWNKSLELQTLKVSVFVESFLTSKKTVYFSSKRCLYHHSLKRIWKRANWLQINLKLLL